MTAGADPRIRRTLPRPPRARRASGLLRRIGGPLAEERVTRVLAFGFLPGSVVFGLLAAPALAGQADLFPLWWDEAAFCGVTLPCILLGSLAFSVPIGLLRGLAAVALAADLAAQSTIPLVISGPIPGGGAPWFDQIGALGTIAAVLAVPPAIAALIALGSGALTFVDRLATDATDPVLDGAQNALYVVLFSITFVGLGVSSVAAARAADSAEADALRAATAAAADEARERERARINGLVHDRVLATLLTAARRVPGSATHERTDARRALDGLHALLTDDGGEAGDLTGQELVWQVQAVTTELVPEAAFGYDVAADLVVPGEAIDAISGAVEEALRNSVRHSAAENRTVHVRIVPTGVEVDVLDDGVGFDRARVPSTRLGIAESIEGRMRAVAGGSAVVVAREGVGTRVRLRWARS